MKFWTKRFGSAQERKSDPEVGAEFLQSRELAIKSAADVLEEEMQSLREKFDSHKRSLRGAVDVAALSGLSAIIVILRMKDLIPALPEMPMDGREELWFYITSMGAYAKWAIVSGLVSGSYDLFKMSGLAEEIDQLTDSIRDFKNASGE